MLSFGPPRVRASDLVATLNYVRNHWGNQAPPIEPTTKRAPTAIRALDDALLKALQAGDLVGVGNVYSKERAARLVRRHLDAVDADVSSTESIVETYRNWLLTVREVNSVDLQQAGYAELEDDTVIFAHGRIVLTATLKDGGPARAFDGDFVRVYVKEPLARDAQGRCVCDEDKVPILVWRLAFDFATTPMQIGCPPGREGELCPAVDEGRLGYAEIQKILSGLNQKASQAPHANFWELPYAEFLALKFPYAQIPGGDDHPGQPRPRGGRDGRRDEPREGAPGRPRRDRGRAGPALGAVGHPAHAEERRQDVAGRPRPDHPLARSRPPRGGAATPRGTRRRAARHAARDGHERRPSSRSRRRGPRWRSAWGFAEVAKFFQSLQPKVGGAPHKEFWKLSYAEFLKFSFPIFSENATARLVEPGKPGRSNLLLALRKQPMVIVKDDGTETTYDIGRAMPPKGKGSKPSAEDLARLEAWIVAGCPEKAGPVAARRPPRARPRAA